MIHLFKVSCFLFALSAFCSAAFYSPTFSSAPCTLFVRSYLLYERIFTKLKQALGCLINNYHIISFFQHTDYCFLILCIRPIHRRFIPRLVSAASHSFSLHFTSSFLQHYGYIPKCLDHSTAFRFCRTVSLTQFWLSLSSSSLSLVFVVSSW